MKQYVGLDVSLETTFVSVVGERGREVWKGKIKSTPQAIFKTIRKHAPAAVKVGFETGALSTWHWHSLKEMGLPVVCLDARHANAALSMQTNKTDANDALGLAQILRTGWIREVKVKSMDSHLIRTMLRSRKQMVGMRTKLTNHLRGVLKTFGLVLKKASGKSFEKRVRELTVGRIELDQIMESMLTVWRSLCEQIEVLDKALGLHAKEDDVCQLLMTVPGVGPITALCFLAAVDDPKRFKKSSSVGAYMGLTPRRYQSGEVDRKGRISKCGDAMARSYLYEAANIILTRVGRWSKLKAWGMRIMKRSGAKKAKVAMARKLAVIMHRMWMDGTAFIWGDPKKA